MSLQLKNITVLVVDDNPHMRALIAEILKAVGVRRPREAGDGDAALALLKAEPVDVVFTDLLMKPTGGVEFVRRLRAAGDGPNVYVPVIVISGQTTESAVAEARDAGVNEVIAKPITARSVLERLRLVIEHPRPFVRSRDFFGPDRRRRDEPWYRGPRRRVSDSTEIEV